MSTTDHILALLADGSASVSELAERTATSTIRVRRALSRLQQQRQVCRVWGGRYALVPEGSMDFSHRFTRPARRA